MHTKLLHICPRFQVNISIPITDRSINKTLQGTLINTVIICSDISNKFFFNSQHKRFNMETFIDKNKDKFLFQSRRKINNPLSEVIIKSSSQIPCGAESNILIRDKWGTDKNNQASNGNKQNFKSLRSLHIFSLQFLSTLHNFSSRICIYLILSPLDKNTFSKTRS